MVGDGSWLSEGFELVQPLAGDVELQEAWLHHVEQTGHLPPLLQSLVVTLPVTHTHTHTHTQVTSAPFMQWSTQTLQHSTGIYSQTQVLLIIHLLILIQNCIYLNQSIYLFIICICLFILISKKRTKHFEYKTKSFLFFKRTHAYIYIHTYKHN